MQSRLATSGIFLPAGVAALLFLSLPPATQAQDANKSACVTCHEKTTPGIVGQWRESKHSKMGIECKSCHQAAANTPASKKHGGIVVTPLVTPKTCGQCHADEEKQFSASHHASAAKFIGSLDNVLGEIVEGGQAANAGCKQCHGSTVALLPDGSLDARTWPNTGIGRLNLDGSAGTCQACHSQHSFSIAQARTPETCGKCHLGPDHPQLEVYNESKHGIAYHANLPKMNLASDSWIVGKDYSAAPNCTTCHMGATPNQAATHDVGTRLSWTLRPAISTKQEKADTRRAAMQDVCKQCHGQTHIASFYQQYDGTINLYNEKFAKPAKEMMDALTAEKLLTATPFDAKIKWTYYELWHHEGRRARHGAAMMGPDYVQWHGMYEVANVFYNEFLPEVRALKPELVDKLLERPEHQWIKGMAPEDREKILQFYKEHYGQ